MTSLEDLEMALGRAGDHPRLMAGSDHGSIDVGRVAANFAAIEAELNAPRASRLARLLKRLGVEDRIVPLVTATPALRRSWIIAVTVAMLFALNAASSAAGNNSDRIVVFLTIAPLVPILGVAMAFGPAVDPTHEVAIAAPMDGFRLFLVRAITVFTASTVMLLIGSLLVPAGGITRIGWLLPAFATTGVTMAISTRVDPRMAAGGVGSLWIIMVVIVSQAAAPSAMFGPVTQVLSGCVALAAAAAFARQRRHLDELSAPGDR